MSLPGFTAANSLGASSHSYYGAATLSAVQADEVNPEFLGAIGELFEKIKDAFSGALKAAADGLGHMISNLQSSGGRPFACGNWAAGMLACSGGRPTYSAAEMLSRCAGSNLGQAAACATITGTMYGIVERGCRENPNGIGQMLGQICRGS